MTIERKLWGDVMHIEELSFPLIHAFQTNTSTKGKLQDPPFTRSHSPINQTTFPLIPTWDPMGLDTMGYKDDTLFARYLMTFVGNLNRHLVFPMCQPRSSSQGFKRTDRGPRALMLTSLGLAFSQKWHRFFFAIDELGSL